jgi:hypothetical protein
VGSLWWFGWGGNIKWQTKRGYFVVSEEGVTVNRARVKEVA